MSFGQEEVKRRISHKKTLQQSEQVAPTVDKDVATKNVEPDTALSSTSTLAAPAIGDDTVEVRNIPEVDCDQIQVRTVTDLWERARLIETNIIPQQDVDGSESFACGFCQMRFNKRFNAKRHVQRKHVT